jgi:hypothetical protein
MNQYKKCFFQPAKIKLNDFGKAIGRFHALENAALTGGAVSDVPSNGVVGHSHD